MINKVILLGNLGKDPDTRFTANGKAVTRFSLATSNTWTDANGEKQQATEWHTVVVLGETGRGLWPILRERASGLRRRRAPPPILRQQRRQRAARH